MSLERIALEFGSIVIPMLPKLIVIPLLWWNRRASLSILLTHIALVPFIGCIFYAVDQYEANHGHIMDGSLLAFLMISTLISVTFVTGVSIIERRIVARHIPQAKAPYFRILITNIIMFPLLTLALLARH